MTGTALNRQFIYPGNMCFGCGPDNPEGLRIEIHRDGEALDGMAGWVVFILHNDVVKGMPPTTQATMRFKKAARVSDELTLHAEVAREADGRTPFLVKAAIRDPQGEVPSEAEYEYVLVPHGKCPHPDHRGKRAAGIDALPDHYLRHFGAVA